MAEESPQGEESASVGLRTEAEIRELMGMFDAPSFARRGQSMEFSLARLQDRCRSNRSSMLDMVRLRLKQWARASSGPDDWQGIFTASVAGLWILSDAEEPNWSQDRLAHRRRRAIARDLVASVVRFNDRWLRHANEINLDSINLMIRQYNQYYVIEKECVMGSARLAARFFHPEPEMTIKMILEAHPPLPVPEMI